MANEQVEIASKCLTMLDAAVLALNSSNTAVLTGKAYEHLEKLIAEDDGAFANDPALAKETYLELARMRCNELETCRRLVDSIVRLRNLSDGAGQGSPSSNEIMPEPSVSNQQMNPEESTFSR